ncbi:MAG TPA: 3-deoxy-manno-octulosonate cytidylyltransferase [Devosiaceae bacterium]
MPIIVPARYASTRFPGKMLVPMTSPSGETRSLVGWTAKAALRASPDGAVVVATDDIRIARDVEGICDVVMTAPERANGSERVSEAAETLGLADDAIVVNLQGDAPLTPPHFISELVAALETHAGWHMATPVLKLEGAALATMQADRKAGRVGATTAVFDRTGRALYFSKEILPSLDAAAANRVAPALYHHVGVYAYRAAAVKAYAALEPTPLEKAEGLEQLRLLEHGYTVGCVVVEGGDRPFWEVNNPGDVELVSPWLE